MLSPDEFTEFRRDPIEGLRQPLEDGRVVLTRMLGTVMFPARVIENANVHVPPPDWTASLER